VSPAWSTILSWPEADDNLNRMSLAPYYYRPITPPEAAAGQRGHRRNISNLSNASSYYNCATDTSPESVITNITTPNRSPVLRQNGPTLLPKIRTQDSTTPAAAFQVKPVHKRESSLHVPQSNAVQRPYMYRSSTEPVECATLMSPISNVSRSRAASVAPSPGFTHATLDRTKKMHARSGSMGSLDGGVLARYGYPTYRQMPVYQQQQQTPSPALFPQDYSTFQSSTLLDAPSISLDGTFDFPIDLEALSRPSSMSPPPQTLASQPPVDTSSLISYLAQPTQPINLVRHLNPGPARGTVSHFWWDVRNLRTWDSFSLSTFSMIPDLMTLLTFQHETTALPSCQPLSSTLQTLSPSNESDLTSMITKVYFPRANAAALHSLGGPNSIALYAAPTNSTSSSGPSFLANYPSDGDRTLSGIPRGRVVGIAKSFDKWNSGMRREGPARKVEYLKGLAHIQKCMRDHSCRYGFIMTEIELLCVRVGCDERGMPFFGKLEIAEPIPTKTALDLSALEGAESTLFDGDSCQNPMSEALGDVPMTASLALYFLLMLAKQHPLPGQPGSFMDVGASGALTRQRVWDGVRDLMEEEVGKEGKDKWIPEPQMGEKREAKTVRGWVWPSDPWHKREGGGGKRRG
jgi:hypothetical protein